jgi:hypothetical protein
MGKRLVATLGLFIAIVWAAAAPAAHADELGCTTTLVGQASSPQSDADVIECDHYAKFCVGANMAIYPLQSIDYTLDIATWEAGAATAFADCIR